MRAEIGAILGALGVVFTLSPSVAHAQTRRVFAYEYTEQTEQHIVFTERDNTNQTVQVSIHLPGGTLHSTQTVILRPLETVTIDDPVLDWGLPVAAGHGTPTTDTAYGIVATSPGFFTIIANNDRIQHGGVVGSGAIWVRDAATDMWWGHRNFDSGQACNAPPTQEDYFYVFNPNATATNVTLTAHDTAGNVLTVTNDSVAAFATEKYYLQCELGVSSSQRDIGIHLSAANPVHVTAFDHLGKDWDKDAAVFKDHAVTTGVFSPFKTDCQSASYVWTETFAAAQLSAARLTNPNGFAVNVTQTIYVVDDGGSAGDSYQNSAVIPAFGTIELGFPTGNTWETGLKNESINGRYTHARIIEASAPIHAHVSYHDQIDLPSVPRTDWWWGNFQNETQHVFLINPGGTNVTINAEAFNYTTGTGSTPLPDTWPGPVIHPGTGASINPTNLMLPHDAFWVSYTSGDGPAFSSSQVDVDTTYHFFSDTPFALHLQESHSVPDVLPLDCAGTTSTTTSSTTTSSTSSTTSSTSSSSSSSSTSSSTSSTSMSSSTSSSSSSSSTSSSTSSTSTSSSTSSSSSSSSTSSSTSSTSTSSSTSSSSSSSSSSTSTSTSSSSSSTSSSSSSTTAASTSTSTSTTTLLRHHFQCYEVKPAEFPATTVSEVDRFGSQSVTLRFPHRLCAPASKNGEGIVDPVQHLVGYETLRSPFTRQTNQTIVNQFGSIAIDLTRRDVLMVPSAKSLVGPAAPLQPPLIDHFQCYRARRVGISRHSQDHVSVEDQFETVAIDLVRPYRLCVPVDKNGEDPTAPTDPGVLLCYRSKSRIRFGTMLRISPTSSAPTILA